MNPNRGTGPERLQISTCSRQAKALVGALAIEIPNGLVQNLVSGLILNFDTKRLARKIRLASSLLAEIVIREKITNLIR